MIPPVLFLRSGAFAVAGALGMPGAALPMMGITAGAQSAYEAGRGGKSLDGQAVFGFVPGAIRG